MHFRPWRALGAIAATLVLVLAVDLVVLARLASHDPGVRLQHRLSDLAPGADVTVVAAPSTDGAADATAVLVTVPDALAPAAAGVVLRAVWQGYDARLGSVGISTAGSTPVVVGAAELRTRFGARPAGLSESTYSQISDRARTVAILAVVAVFAMFGLVVCASIAAVAVGRRRSLRRRRKTG